MPFREMDRHIVDSYNRNISVHSFYGCTNYGGYRTCSTYRIHNSTRVVWYRARANLNFFCKDHFPRAQMYIAIFREASFVNDSYSSRGSVLAEVAEK